MAPDTTTPLRGRVSQEDNTIPFYSPRKGVTSRPTGDPLRKLQLNEWGTGKAEGPSGTEVDCGGAVSSWGARNEERVGGEEPPC